MCNVMWSSLLGNFPRWDRFDCLSRHPGGHVEPDSLIMNHVLQTYSTTLNTLSVPRFVLDVKCAHAQSHTLLTHDINFSGWVFSRVSMKDLPNLVRLEPGEALEPWAEARCNPCIRCHIQQLPLRVEFTEAKPWGVQAKRGVQCSAAFLELINQKRCERVFFESFWQFQNPHLLFEKDTWLQRLFSMVFNRVHFQSQSFTSFCLVGSSVHKKGGI